jgi:hypothetical protein
MDGVTFCGNCGARMTAPSQTQEENTQTLASDNLQSNPEAFKKSESVQLGSGQQTGAGQYHSGQTRDRQPYVSVPTYSSPAGGPSNGGMVMPKDYLVESIIVTVISFLCCCCSPMSIILGIIAIIKANNVKMEFERGNLSEAIHNSEQAKLLTIWTVIVAVVWYIISFMSMFFFMPAFKENYHLDQLFDMM